VIKTADWIIDLGPEGGDGGGNVVVQGTPEKVARTADSHTGQFLKQLLLSSQGKERPVDKLEIGKREAKLERVPDFAHV
jgi:excinuclease ABC subunit A